MASFLMTCDSSPLSLSPTFVLPEDKRPHLQEVSYNISIPVIDLKLDHSLLVQSISEACENYGFFQVINHGVPEDLCKRMLNTVTEFFRLPPEERAQYFTRDHTKKVKIFNYYAKVGDEKQIMMWSETFTLPWSPVKEEFIHLIPQNPPQYKEVYGDYAREMGVLMDRLLGLISAGLGLEESVLKKKIGEKPELYSQANYYPECPEPELTLGLGVHTDIVALTVLLQCQGVSGLQILKDDKWVSVDPIPNSFVVNLADQMQVLSNGRYKSVHHRAVTNTVMPRVSLAMFYAPNGDAMIEPIEDLIDEEHPPIYRRYSYREFMQEFYRQEGARRRVKEAFELPNSNLTTHPLSSSILKLLPFI